MVESYLAEEPKDYKVGDKLWVSHFVGTSWLAIEKVGRLWVYLEKDYRFKKGSVTLVDTHYVGAIMGKVYISEEHMRYENTLERDWGCFCRALRSNHSRPTRTDLETAAEALGLSHLMTQSS